MSKALLWSVNLIFFTLVAVLGFAQPVSAQNYPACNPGLSCYPTNVPGSTACMNGSQVSHCCPVGKSFDQSVGRCRGVSDPALPYCATGVRCDSRLSISANCVTPQELPVKCCAAGQQISSDGTRCETADTFDPANSGLTQGTLDALNPLKTESTVTEDDLSNPGGIISRVLRFAFPLAGLILFVMLIWSGFEILAGSSGGTKSVDAGKQRATAAVIGFVLLFVSYWVAQIVGVIFGVKIF